MLPLISPYLPIQPGSHICEQGLMSVLCAQVHVHHMAGTLGGPLSHRLGHCINTLSPTGNVQ
ncbi:hypothetical protein DPMN_121933 [Dreissena polymorpha]|uniref:Uncharacterized protein n=1 Tax=Dreissena polymorpha TaxID=45954 RepID=A0A9D4JRI2_DREPO|nr:hypothetical protein DPMN_121933 [Dreissena polymorpha]